MAEAVVSIALKTLRDLLLEEDKYLAGVGDEVRALQTQLSKIKSLLKDADRKQHESEIVRHWIAEIRNLAYRGEDAVGSYAVQISSNTVGSYAAKQLLRRFSRVLSCFSLHQLGHEISDIKSELARISWSMQDYGIRSIVEGAERKTETFPNFEIGDCFVGREDELKRLASLVGDDEQHRVISVLGMGGIGKTTIVKKVFDEMIQTKKFDSFAWVCITQQCQIRAVLEGVLKHLISEDGEGISRLSEEELIEKLCDVQRAKRCLIVLDDLWEISQWNGFKHAFLVKDFKSKILVTTRKQNVAEIGLSLELGVLDENEAWELLKKKSFPHGNNPDFALQEKFREIGEEMVRKCRYLPLAVSLLGGVLNKKNSMREWELVNANINTSIYSGDSGEGHDRKGNQIEEVLNLSYQDLPYYLKPCFLYLGRLREDEIIYVEDLYRMWIAQGMISYENIPGNEGTLVEIAEIYLSELALRCLVQVEVEVGHDFVPLIYCRSCKLHDVVRELCLSMGNKEDFGVQTLDYQDGRFSILLQKSLSCIKTRHLVIHFQRELECGDRAFACEEATSKHLRSLEIQSHIYGKNIEFPAQSIFDLEIFKMLKSLVIEKFKFAVGKLPRGITNLVHLKYLRLSRCELDELPSSISNLAYLDTLCLFESYHIRVPNVLEKMIRLKHLILPYYGETNGNYRLRLDVGDELETLMWYDSSVCEIKSITRMKNLRRFSGVIRDNESLSTIINAIATEWTKLQHCSVSIEQGCKLSTKEEGLTALNPLLPNCAPSLLNQVLACPNLHYLTIRVELGKQLAKCGSNVIIRSKLVRLELILCEIEDDPMVILGKLPSLKELRFYARSFVGEELTCHALSFPRLLKLKLTGLPYWKEWRVEEGAMPVLSELEIGYSPRLKKLPDGLSCISTLQKLRIIRMLPEFRERVSASGEDFHIVRHVPSIFIRNY